MMKIEVFSHYLFDEQMKSMNLDDSNVDDIKDTAFISIIGTKECLKYYLEEDETKHYFNDNHKNVLNLDFDDIGQNVLYHGHLFKTMTMEQAEKAVDFIENIIDENIKYVKIHCRAGMSRSRAFAEFIYSYCIEHNVDVEYEERNSYRTMLNQHVMRKLNHAYWKKHKLNCYANDEEYEDELINTPLLTIG